MEPDIKLSIIAKGVHRAWEAKRALLLVIPFAWKLGLRTKYFWKNLKSVS